MKTITIGANSTEVPQIALGCMRINTLAKKDAECLVRSSMEHGINFFDHADIYGKGTCEAFFAEAVGMNSTIREKMILQTKCGIRPGGCFDFSKEHILKSADASLAKLKTDYLDFFLLHRPDTLMEPEEVAEAFHILKTSGKVKNFGVSNQNPYQISLLNQYCDNQIRVNQLQLSMTNTGMIDAGFNVNMTVDGGINRDGGILEYCRLHKITIQAWSPFQYGFFEGVFLNSDKYPKLNEVIDTIAKKYGVTNNAIAVAWISRHPAKIQTIVGTTNLTRLDEICAGSHIVLTREEWYELYRAAGNVLP